MSKILEDNSLNSDEETKIRFFESVKNDNISEVVKFFRNDKLKVWLLREEDEYTGIKYFK
jgi:hypothetical protein